MNRQIFMLVVLRVEGAMHASPPLLYLGLANAGPFVIPGLANARPFVIPGLASARPFVI